MSDPIRETRTHETDRARLRELREMPPERLRVLRNGFVATAVAIVAGPGPIATSILAKRLAEMAPDLAAEADEDFRRLRDAGERFARAAGEARPEAMRHLCRAVVMMFAARSDENHKAWRSARG